MSEQQKLKISAALKGRPSPLRGVPQSEAARRAKSVALKGRPKSREHIAKIRAFTSSEAYKMKLSRILKGRIFSLETRARMAESRRKAKGVFRNTSIEKKLERLLRKLGITYQKLKRFSFLPVHAYDFYLPSLGLVVECDGCYWHGCPEHYPGRAEAQRLRDIKHSLVAESSGLKVVRLWEHDILSGRYQPLVDALRGRLVHG